MTTRTICEIERRREHVAQLRDEVGGLVGPAEEPEQRQREEDERHEREQREVGDHRRQVRPAVGEELGERLSHRREYVPGVDADDRPSSSCCEVSDDIVGPR